MNAAPQNLTCPADLNYPDAEPVHLDVARIVARGIRIRRRRAAGAATAAVVCVAVLVAGVVLAQPEPPARTLGSAGGRQVHGPAHAARYHGSLNGPAAGGSGTFQGFRNGRSGGHLVRARIAASATLPSRYAAIGALAGDQAGDGVWFWSADRARIMLFHLGSAGLLRSWPVRPWSRGVRPATASGFAVTPAGVAWIGLGATLISLDTRSGRTRTWRIPAPRINQVTYSRSAPGPAGVFTVQAVAARPGGEVVVADGNASSVQLLDARTGRWRQILLPAPDDQPVAVGFARDGTLGVGYRRIGPGRQPAGVLIDRARGPALARTVRDPSGVTAFGSAGLLVGTVAPDVVSAGGRVAPLAYPAVALGGARPPGPPAALPGGRLAAIVRSGPPDYPPATWPAAARPGTSLVLEFPARSAPAAPSRPVALLPPGRLPLHLLVADARGHLWVVPGNGSSRTVDLLGPG